METYRVLLLGAPQSGKTVYLTMLNHFFETGGSLARGLRFNVTPPAAAERLHEKYLRLTDLQKGWPDQTDTREDPQWSFECYVVRQQATYPVLKVTYLDFAGEWYRDSRSADPTNADKVFDTIGGAHATLLLIDGAKVLAWLAGGSHGMTEDAFFGDCIQPTLRYFANIRHPIHVVITKWDLLAHRFSLKSVRERLWHMKDPWLRDLSRNLREVENPPLRIIPMSSLGDFAVLGDDGRMQKRRTSPQPFNLKVPLIAVLPDYFQQKANYASAAAGQGAGPWLGTESERAALVVLAMYGLTKVSRQLRAMIEKGDLPVRRRMSLRVGPKFGKVHDQRSAYLYAVACVASALREFERDFSGSLVGK